jgi:hypothetical protein
MPGRRLAAERWGLTSGGGTWQTGTEMASIYRKYSQIIPDTAISRLYRGRRPIRWCMIGDRGG